MEWKESVDRGVSKASSASCQVVVVIRGISRGISRG